MERRGPLKKLLHVYATGRRLSKCRLRFLLTHDAEHDLENLYDYITMQDSPENEDYVLDRIKKAFL